MLQRRQLDNKNVMKLVFVQNSQAKKLVKLMISPYKVETINVMMKLEYKLENKLDNEFSNKNVIKLANPVLDNRKKD